MHSATTQHQTWRASDPPWARAKSTMMHTMRKAARKSHHSPPRVRLVSRRVRASKARDDKEPDKFRVAIVGGGPSGLLAAQHLSTMGATVDIYEKMPTPGLKFLIAGRGGLNLTHSEPSERFVERYLGSCHMDRFLEKFAADEVRSWAEDLGVETFIGSSRRVFPAPSSLMDKAARVLRLWLRRLEEQGVQLHTGHTWQGFDRPDNNSGRPPALCFTDSTGDKVEVQADAVLLALGGASWSKLGSDGKWVETLSAAGVPVSELRPNNVGFQVEWPEGFADRYAGKPIKDVRMEFNGKSSAGDLMVTEWGIEGGAVCALSSAIIAHQIDNPSSTARLNIDLRPSLTASALSKRLGRPSLAKASFSSRLRKAVRLTPAAGGLLRLAHGDGDPAALRDPERLSALIKKAPLPLGKPQGIEKAISSSGGVTSAGLSSRSGSSLMLDALPGVFVAGEMLDWEAPTGGYLLTGALSTGHAAASEMLQWWQEEQRLQQVDLD